MATVKVEIEQTSLMNEDGHYVDGVVATCSKCDHQTESYGCSPASIRRCLALLREECPEDENNYYVADDDED